MIHFPQSLVQKYEIHEWKHASAILKFDYNEEWQDMVDLLQAFQLKKSWIVKGGGNKSELAKWVDDFMGARGWIEKQFNTAIVVDENRMNYTQS